VYSQPYYVSLDGSELHGSEQIYGGGGVEAVQQRRREQQQQQAAKL